MNAEEIKQTIVDVLKENTHIGSKYLGGEEESIIVFDNSNELCETDKKWFFGRIADEVINKLKSK